MPRYEYRCRACGDTFELTRPMAEASAPAECPAGHDDTVKLISALSVTGVARGTSSAPRGGAAASGGCCGGGCCS